VGNRQDERKWYTIPGHEGLYCRDHLTRRNGKRPDRFIAIRYRNAESKRVVETLGWASDGWTLAQAVSLLRELKENIRLGRRPQSLKEKRAMLEEQRREEARRIAETQVSSITFGELAERYRQWAQRYRLSGKHVSQLLDMHILPELGHMVAADITPGHIERMRQVVAAKHPLTGPGKNDPDATLSPQTVLHCLKTVREVYNFALETESAVPGVMLFSGKNPAVLSKRSRAIHIERSDNRRLRILTDGEIEMLLARKSTHTSDSTELHDMILLSLDTGIRVGELVHLKRESVDVENGTLRILQGSARSTTTKGGTTRVLHVGQLFPEALSMLRRRMRLEAEKKPYLFPGRGDGPRDANALNATLRRIADDLGLNSGVRDARNRVVWHTFRHTYATRMLEHGVDVFMLKELMGHSGVTTTERYLHLCDMAKRKKALAKLQMLRREAEE
jgi:site-specific recombinase, phage integrase family